MVASDFLCARFNLRYHGDGNDVRCGGWDGMGHPWDNWPDRDCSHAHPCSMGIGSFT